VAADLKQALCVLVIANQQPKLKIPEPANNYKNFLYFPQPLVPSALLIASRKLQITTIRRQISLRNAAGKDTDYRHL
jgi:hypothetical protein